MAVYKNLIEFHLCENVNAGKLVFAKRKKAASNNNKQIKKGSLFLRIRLRLPSTINPLLKSVRKRSSNQRNLKTPALRFSVDGKHSGNGAFQKRWRHDNNVGSLPAFSTNTNPKRPLIVPFSSFSSTVLREDIGYVFRVKTPFSNFSRVLWTEPKR